MSVPDSDVVLATVRRCVSQSLAVPEERLLPETRLIDDLGADSLDVVDIVFLLEEQTGVKARSTELGFLTRLDFSSPEVVREGRIHPDLLGRLEPLMPGLSAEEEVTPRVLFSHLTVEAVCRMVSASWPS
ncbi:MAG: hypothetical protein KC621_35130 [Myxococcales bacterium]|nr:hypothetical protein [Myxococcales bacterium]